MRICKISRPYLNPVYRKFPQGRFSTVSGDLELHGHETSIFHINPVRVKNPYVAYGLAMAFAPFKFRSIQSDLVVADNMESAVVAAVIKYIYRIPFVFDFMDDYSFIASFEGHKLRHIALKYLEKIIPRLADHVIASNHETVSFCERMGVPAEKLSVVSNGVHATLFKPENKNERLHRHLNIENNKVVLFRGKMSTYYKVEKIIKAIPTVLDASPSTKFLFVGDGSDLNRLKSLCKEKKINSSAIFTGFVPFNELPQYINLADICLCPVPCSTALALFEYASCAKPIVLASGGTGKMGTSHEIVQKRGALLVEDSPEGFAHGINYLLNHETLAKEMGQRAMELTVQSYDWSRIAGAYEAALMKAVRINTGPAGFGSETKD